MVSIGSGQYVLILLGGYPRQGSAEYIHSYDGFAVLLRVESYGFSLVDRDSADGNPSYFKPGRFDHGLKPSFILGAIKDPVECGDGSRKVIPNKVDEYPNNKINKEFVNVLQML